ncbi:MAG TPA: hypothetical protein PK958_05565, partial [Rhodocyclaceae bacterium]|nr:hypothetical protein [Rhodocyclaceae bacterium]
WCYGKPVSSSAKLCATGLAPRLCAPKKTAPEITLLLNTLQARMSHVLAQRRCHGDSNVVRKQSGAA